MGKMKHGKRNLLPAYAPLILFFVFMRPQVSVRREFFPFHDAYGASMSWTQVSAGAFHTCAVAGDGTVWCWGRNDSGQLGTGSRFGPDSCLKSPSWLACSPKPVRVSGIKNAVMVAAGYAHSCAILSDGTIKCWGRNDWGQLGDFTFAGLETCGKTYQESYPCSTSPVSVTNIRAATVIAAGHGHTCALLKNGTVWCWGRNDKGQLGNAMKNGPEHCGFLKSSTNMKKQKYNDSCSTVAVPVFGVSSAAQISSGTDHACAALSDGFVKCWGDNQSGQLGDKTIKNFSAVAVSVFGILRPTSIAAGFSHTCALQWDGRVKCWGANKEGQFGDGTKKDSALPVEVKQLFSATAISAGVYHTCAALSGGGLSCWGGNESGQLGTGLRSDSLFPLSATNVSDIIALSSGWYHTCAVSSDGSLKCWGKNDFGQVGTGAKYNSQLCGTHPATFSCVLVPFAVTASF